MKTLIILTTSLFLLGGCACFENFGEGPLPPKPDKTITVDREYYVECEELKALEDKTSFEAVLENTVDNVAVYKKCKDRQHNSILLIKKFTNVKD